VKHQGRAGEFQNQTVMARRNRVATRVLADQAGWRWPLGGLDRSTIVVRKLEAETIDVTFVKIPVPVVKPNGERLAEGRFEYDVTIGIAIEIAHVQAISSRETGNR
jgi:hypothetical protein